MFGHLFEKLGNFFQHLASRLLRQFTLATLVPSCTAVIERLLVVLRKNRKMKKLSRVKGRIKI